MVFEVVAGAAIALCKLSEVIITALCLPVFGVALALDWMIAKFTEV